jgi:hypothetical protein
LVWKQNQYLVLRCRKRHSCCNFSYDFAFHLVLSSKLSDPEISTISIMVSSFFFENLYMRLHYILRVYIQSILRISSPYWYWRTEKSFRVLWKCGIHQIWSLNLRVLISILRTFFSGSFVSIWNSVQFKFLVFSDYWSLNTDYC